MSRGAGATIVTGGTGGLGVGVVRALVEAGHDVVVSWIVDDEVERFPADLRDRVRLERADVGSEADLARLVEGCGDGVWAFVHLVGGYLDGAPVAGMDMEGWDRQMALNLRSAALAMRAALPGMVARGGGRIVAVASRTARRPFAGASAYAASKAGVIALVEAASEEVKHDGVCVNCVLPSVIDTPANRAAMPDADHSQWVKPSAAADVIAFLASPDNRVTRGAIIPVYGGA
jgi:NAD(P)-dependent dehydrogenase (short-subunit alcohol dehydrogenase family)